MVDSFKRSSIVTALTALALVAVGCDDATDPPPTTADAVADAATDSAAADTGPDAEPVRPDLEWDVTAKGPYQAGHRLVSVTYTPTGVEPAEARTLDLHLFYPTEDTTGDSPVYLGLFNLGFSFEDAALAPPVVAGGYPLHVFSHGHQGFAGATERNLAFLASHGWVVAAPDHLGNTTTDGPDRSNAIYFLRGQDLAAVLDHLATLPDTDPLSGLLDTNNTVLSGHSFGGYTAFTVAGGEWDLVALQADCDAGAGYGGDPCTEAELAAFAAGVEDDRIKGIIPMAAGDRQRFGDSGLAQIDVPVLMITGDQDDAATPEISASIWSALPAGSAWADIAGGCHQTFAVGGCALIGDEYGWSIVDTYLLAASRAWVLGDASVADILDGSRVIAPEVTFQTR